MSAARTRGFTYVALLIIIAVIGVAMGGAGVVWKTVSQQERERELLFIGDEFRRAIGSYYESSPGTLTYPKSIDDLIEDKRFPSPRRHLRKRYRDPFTGTTEWGLVRGAGEVILGVHSLSTGTPLKRANFPLRYAEFEGAGSHADWKFLHRQGPSAPGGGQPVVPVPLPAIPGLPR